MGRVGSNFSKGLFVYGAPVMPSAGMDVVTGNVFFVDNGNVNASDDSATNGKTKDQPFNTIDYAIGQCTANNGDVIYVMPGHVETISSTGSLVPDVAGISIIGIGQGDDRPELRYSTGTGNSSGAKSCIHITGAGTRISNMIFDVGTTGDAVNPLYGVKIKASNVELSYNTFRTSGSSCIWGRRIGGKGIKQSGSSGAGIIFIGSSKGSTQYLALQNIKINFNDFCPGIECQGNSSGTSIGINMGSSNKTGNSSGYLSFGHQIIGNTFRGNYAVAPIYGGSSGIKHRHIIVADNLIFNEQTKNIGTGSSGKHGLDLRQAVTGIAYRNQVYSSNSSAHAAFDPGGLFCSDNWVTPTAGTKGVVTPSST